MPHLSICATLQNNSFESAVVKIKLGGAPEWTPFGTANSTVVSNSAIAHSGTNHLSLFQNFSGGNNYSGLYQSFNTKPNHKWVFSSYIRNGRGTDYLQTENSAWLQVEFWNNGSYVSTIQNNTNGQGIDSNTPQDDQWLLNSMSITVPENIDTIRFIAIHAYIGTNYNGGSSSFDDLTVKQIPPSLENNSFESAVGKIKSGGAPEWTPFGTANSTVISNSAIAHSGTNYLSLFQNFSGENNYSGIYQKFSVTQGDKLLFSAFLRNGREADYLQEGNSAWLQVEFWNNGSYVNTIQNNTNGQGIDSNTPQDDQWLLNSMSITVPENIDTIHFVAIHTYLGTNYNGGSSSFDDLTVKIVENGTLFTFK